MADYEVIRDKIKTGDMLLFRDHPDGGLRSVIERWIVRHGTAYPWVHVGVAWAEHDRVWIMDITTHGCAPRMLSKCGNFDWAPAPRELSETALTYAQDCFGLWQYSRWQAILGALKRLVIGADHWGQCAEYALAVWRQDSIAPTEIATPGDCADGAMQRWGAPITFVKNEAAK